MKQNHFSIGLVFFNAVGAWKCTDIGTRVITAIHLSDDRYPNEPRWDQGPPYGRKEVVFNEAEMADAYRNEREATMDALKSGRRHPQRFFPEEYVGHSIRRQCEMDTLLKHGGPDAYPMAILEGVRLKDGEELVMDAAHRNAQGDWILEGFSFTRQVAVEIPESEWFALPWADA